MIRSFIILALAVITALASVSSKPLALPADASPRPLMITEPDRATEPGRKGAAVLWLAQAAGADQRGPRTLGAVGNAVEVPSLQCLSTAEAETILRERRLRLGQVHQRASNACPDGGIVAQSPPRGRTVRPGTPIEVVVTTTGNAPAVGATVPELLGLRLLGAYRGL